MRRGWAAALALLPAAAQAHDFGRRFGDFPAGILHPLTALEHALPFFALGLLLGQNDARAARVALALFVIALIAGAVAAQHLAVPGWIAVLNLSSMVLLGGLVALAARLPAWLTALLAVVFGLSHGMANGEAVAADMRLHLFVLGLALCGGLLVYYGSVLVQDLKPAWTQIGVRVLGSWIAAAGLMVLALEAFGTRTL